jgi:hypothetical protein
MLLYHVEIKINFKLYQGRIREGSVKIRANLWLFSNF